MQPRHGRQQCLRLVRAASCHHGENGAGRERVGQTVGGRRGEDGPGTEFQVGGDPVVREPAHGVGEAHGQPGVPRPVLGRAQVRGLGGSARHGGDDRDARRPVGQLACHSQDLVEHRLDQRRVEGMTHPQPYGPAATRLEAGRDGEHRVPRARDHHGTGPVDGCDGRLRPELRERCHDFLLGPVQRHHRAAVGQCLHQAAASGDEPRGIGQIEHPGDMRGRQLADRVAHQAVGSHAPRLEKPEQRHLEGEQSGLGEVRTVHESRLRRAGLGGQHSAERLGEQVVQVPADLVEGVGEDGEGGAQFGTHPGALGALSGEQEGRPDLRVRQSSYGSRCVPALRERAQRVQHPGPVTGRHDRALGEGGARHGQRVGDVGG